MLERTSPNFFELMIALAGGAAGAYASISPRLSVAFVGVAIATALVPPLASCGLLLARGDFDLAEGAFLLAVMNIVAIQSRASFVMWVSGIAPGKLRQSDRAEYPQRRHFVALGGNSGRQYANAGR